MVLKNIYSLKIFRFFYSSFVSIIRISRNIKQKLTQQLTQKLTQQLTQKLTQQLTQKLTQQLIQTNQNYKRT